MRIAALLLALLALVLTPAVPRSQPGGDSRPCLSSSCHGGILSSRILHPPVAEGECSACHLPAARPASSDHGAESFLPSRRGADLCLPCHLRTADRAKAPFPHAPAAGGCTSCHNPHGSDFPFLLVAAYPDETYPVYRAESYDLCWICHEEELAGEKFTESSTAFRMGKRNFHYSHLHKRSGMACRACHEPHGTPQEHLMRRKGPSGEGGWKAGMRFISEPAGGRCIGGCHKDIRYRR